LTLLKDWAVHMCRKVNMLVTIVLMQDLHWHVHTVDMLTC